MNLELIEKKFEKSKKTFSKHLSKVINGINHPELSVIAKNIQDVYSSLPDPIDSNSSNFFLTYLEDKEKEISSVSSKYIKIFNSRVKQQKEKKASSNILKEKNQVDAEIERSRFDIKTFKENLAGLKAIIKETKIQINKNVQFVKDINSEKDKQSFFQTAGLALQKQIGSPVLSYAVGNIGTYKTKIRNFKKEWKQKSSKEKMMFGLSALSKVAGLATGSPALLMAQSKLDDAQKTSKENRNKLITFRKNIKKIEDKNKENKKIKAAGGFNGLINKSSKFSSLTVGDGKTIDNKVQPEKVDIKSLSSSKKISKVFKSRTTLPIKEPSSVSVEPLGLSNPINKTTVDGKPIKAADGMKGVVDTSTPVVHAIEKNNNLLEKIYEEQKATRSFHEESARDLELAKKPKSGLSSKEPKSEKEQLAEAVKEKGLIGGVFDTVKSRMTEKLVDKLSSGPGLGKNLLKGGLTAGAGVAGGYVGYKGGSKLAELAGAEEGGTVSKIAGGVGAVAGGVGSAMLANKGLSKLPFFSKMLPKEGMAVHITNPEDINGGSSVTDLIPGKGGKFSKLLSKIPGMSKMSSGVAEAGAKLGGSGLLKGGARLAKFAGPAGLALTAGMAGFDAYKGFKNADQITGKAPGEKSNLLEKTGAGAASAMSGLTFGLVKPETMYKGLSTAMSWTPFGLAYKGIKKANEIIVTKDKSPESKLQTDLAKKNSKLSEKNLSENQNAAEKADENKTLMEKLSSIWEDPSKSPLEKISAGLGSVWGSAKQAVSGAYDKVTGGGYSGKEFDIGSGVGSIAAKYESGKGGAGTISSGKGDFGGKSYGTHQLSSKQGTLQGFLKSSGYGQQFAGMQAGSAQFDAKWKELAANDPNFGKAQKEFITKTHANPVLEKLEKAGWDVKNRVIQEMAYSSGVQYGPGKGAAVMIAAMKQAGKDPKNTSIHEIIDIVQNYKANNVGTHFKSSSKETQAGVAKRHAVGERADLHKAADALQQGNTAVAQKQPTQGSSSQKASVAQKQPTQGSSSQKAAVAQKQPTQGSSSQKASVVGTAGPAKSEVVSNDSKSSKEPKSKATAKSVLSSVPIPNTSDVDTLKTNVPAYHSETETTKLKQKEISIENKKFSNIADSTGKAINNVTNIMSSGSNSPQPVNILTGDIESFASRLARNY